MSRTTTAYQCDAQGVFLGDTLVQEDVFAPGMFLLPPGCVLQPPPAFDVAAQRAIFTDDGWQVQTLAPPPEPDPVASPEFATKANRPVTGLHEVAVVVDGFWTVLSDWRSTFWRLSSGMLYVITQIGEEPPEGAQQEEPPGRAGSLRESR